MDEFFARNRLSAYLDGELDTSEAREVEDALTRSPELRAELDDLRASIALLRAGGPVPAPAGFARRLEKRVAQEPLRVGWVRHLQRVRIEAVMLAAAAAVVIVWAGRSPPSDDPPAEAPTAVASGETPVAKAPAPPEALEDGTTKPAVDVAGIGVEAPVASASNAPASADGVLGDDAFAKKAALKEKVASSQKSGSKPTKKGFAKDVEVVPYAPAWEQQGALDAAPTVKASSQIRLTLTSDTGLKDLDAFARNLGGSLTDERGRQLPTHLIEIGETRKVKLSLPAATALSQGELYSRLQAFGTAELVSSGTFYPSGANVPVVIEVSRE